MLKRFQRGEGMGLYVSVVRIDGKSSRRVAAVLLKHFCIYARIGDRMRRCNFVATAKKMTKAYRFLPCFEPLPVFLMVYESTSSMVSVT